jgi:hypothetical protein
MTLASSPLSTLFSRSASLVNHRYQSKTEKNKSIVEKSCDLPLVMKHWNSQSRCKDILWSTPSSILHIKEKNSIKYVLAFEASANTLTSDKKKSLPLD